MPDKLRESDIRTLLREGRRSYGPWAVLYARRRGAKGEAAPGPRSRFTVFASGKFPNAVKRNRARRVVRETCRPLVAGLRAPWDLLFRIRPEVLEADFPERRRVLERLLREAGVMETEGDRDAARGGREARR